MMWWGKVGKWFNQIVSIASGGKLLDEDWEEIEALLIQADFGVELVDEIMIALRDAMKSQEDIKSALRSVMLSKFLPDEGRRLHLSAGRLKVLFLGVNGTGKTTTVAKLAYYFKEKGKSVVLVAADTFRAAAIEQLAEWGSRLSVPVIRQMPGSDAGAVVYDGVASFKARGYDIMLVDTAGRMHTKRNLMEEVGKINKILVNQLPDVPQENLLVVDSTIGQNSYNQAMLFKEKVGLNGIVLTKMDGTSKGGVVLRIEKELGVPVKFIGTGERVEDLEEFSPELFIDRILG